MPEKPAKNYSELKLARLTQASELLDNLADNDQKVVEYLNGVDSQLDNVFATGTIDAQAVAPPAVTALDREVRNYTFDVFGSLERYLNNLIKVANAYGVLDPQTGQATATVTLTPPTGLTLDSDFMDAINALWSTIESTLNDLQSYADEY